MREPWGVGREWGEEGEQKRRFRMESWSQLKFRNWYQWRSNKGDQEGGAREVGGEPGEASVKWQ